MPTSTISARSSVMRAGGSRPSAASATGSPMAESPSLASEAGASESDARLVRNVRWRLVAFSGGSTLLVLLVLGIALYLAVASTLAGASVSQLEARTTPWVAALEGQRGSGEPPDFGFQPGRGNTFL